MTEVRGTISHFYAPYSIQELNCRIMDSYEHYSLLGQSRNMGRFISTDHWFAYKDCSVYRSSQFYEAVYFCLFEI